MLKRSLTLLGVLLVVTSLVWSATVSRAQTSTTIVFPASAVIRGENVWLRAAPALQTDVLTLLQRGNAITITGAPTLADGDEFYPVQVTATGQSGWVRVLFIDPRSVVAIAAPPVAPTAPPVAPTAVPPVTTPEPAQDNGGGNGNKNNNKKKNNTQNKNGGAAQETTPVPEATAPPAPAPTATPVPAVPATPPPANPPAEAPPPSSGAITYTGVGATTSQPFTLQPGRYRATATMEASQPTGFTAILRGPDNSEQQVFDESIDAPQSWTATANVRIDTAGDYYFDVTNTTDAWTIVLEPRQ
jgi:hypothetical protein